MDPSALIFVALALAWAAYLIPKALEHHDAGARTRTISTFSERIRVLARREAISRRRSALVVDPAAKTADPTVAPDAPASPVAPAVPTSPATASMVDTNVRTVEVIVEEVLTESMMETTTSGRLHLPSQRPRARRTAGATAAKRRQRVLGLLVFLFAATAATAAGHVITLLWLAAPSVLIVAWLVACRLMVKGERARRGVPLVGRVSAEGGRGEAPTVPAEFVVPVETVTIATFADDDTTDLPAIKEPVAEGTWEPVQAPLPTYVSKPAAPRRTVTTIDLDSTGVWTSGRTDADTAIAREADAARATETTEQHRATGA